MNGTYTARPGYIDGIETYSVLELPDAMFALYYDRGGKGPPTPTIDPEWHLSKRNLQMPPTSWDSLYYTAGAKGDSVPSGASGSGGWRAVNGQAPVPTVTRSG